jgi:hypothetical protein
MKGQAAAAVTSRLDIHPFRDDIQICIITCSQMGGETPLFTAALFNNSHNERTKHHE